MAVDMQEVRRHAWHCAVREHNFTANLLRDLADELSRLRSLNVTLEMSNELTRITNVALAEKLAEYCKEWRIEIDD